jgi:hypothetical protein
MIASLNRESVMREAALHPIREHASSASGAAGPGVARLVARFGAWFGARFVTRFVTPIVVGGVALVAALAGVSQAVAQGAPGAAAAPSAGRLPLRNLLVEVRQSVDDSARERRAGAAGDVVVGTAGASVQGALEWRSSGRERQLGSVQQVLVLNGGVAGVRLAAQTPWQFVQLAWTPQGISAWPATVWTETATGFRVTPRWPGAGAPVTLELSAEAAGPAGVLTTAQIPLGEWVTVARGADEQRIDDRGTLSSSSAERRAERLLQVRVTAP